MSAEHQRLQGVVFVITGRLPGLSHAALRARLEGLGATSRKTVTSKTDVVIAGAAPGRALAQARDWGVPVLGPAQLAALLEGDTLAAAIASRPEAPTPTQAEPNDALGKLRALVHEAPSEASWEAICASLDACAPEAVAVAAEYVAQATSGWPRLGKGRSAAPSGRFRGRAWEDGTLCVAPEGWVREALAGRDHPKFAAARGLAYTRRGITHKVASKLFQCASLSGLRELDLGHNALSGRFVKALVQSPHLAGVERLDLSDNPCGTSGFAPLMRAPMMAHLRVLGIADIGLATRHAPTLAKLNAPRLEALQISGNAIGGRLGAALVSARLPALECLHIASNLLNNAGARALAEGAWPKLEALYATHNALELGGMVALTSMVNAPRLRVLDVGHQHSPTRGDSVFEPLFQTTHPRLERVEMSGNAWLGGCWAHTMAESAEQPALRVFRAETTDTRDRGLEALLRAPALRHVRTLGLEHNRIFDDGAQAIAEATHMSQLTHLELADNPITSRGFAHLLRSPHLMALEAVTIGVPEVDLGDGYFTALLACAHRKPSLRQVRIHNTRPSVAVLRAMVEAPELAHVRSVVFDLDPSAYPAGVIEQVRARFWR